MSAFRPLLSPLTGTAVAAIVLYSMAGTLSTRTHQLSESLHLSSHSLRRLAQVDDTEDLVSKAHVAPDAATMVSSWENFKEGEKEKLRAAYTLPSRPSLREEVKARWNVSADLTSKRHDSSDPILPLLHSGVPLCGHSLLLRDRLGPRHRCN